MKKALQFFLILSPLLLANCASVGTNSGDLNKTDEKHTVDVIVKNARSKDFYEVFGKKYYPFKSIETFSERGIASWYGKKFHGKKTANGETYDMYKISAAHKTLPLPSLVKITNLENQKTLNVRVNDRGPFVAGRIVDLSFAAAVELEIVKNGTALVELSFLENLGKTGDLDDAIQLGAFKIRKNAELLVNSMRTKLPNKLKLEILEDGDSFFKVFLRLDSTLENESELIDILKEFGLRPYPIKVKKLKG